MGRVKVHSYFGIQILDFGESQAQSKPKSEIPKSEIIPYLINVTSPL